MQLAIPEKFLEGVFTETHNASQLWQLGQGRHVVGVLCLSRLYNNMRASNFSDDKVGSIQNWSKVPVAGTPMFM